MAQGEQEQQQQGGGDWQHDVLRQLAQHGQHGQHGQQGTSAGAGEPALRLVHSADPEPPRETAIR
ncbi:hypothetical protein IPZ69_32900, partial [Streptomyces olivochromogenes]|nr:hypothetical protein [Streptomyces olivochromogenes]